MASIKKTPAGTFQIRVTNKLLPKTLWATFDSLEQAQAYTKQLEGLLAQGIVPAALLERSAPKQEIWTISRCIAEYLRANSVPISEVKLLDTVRSDFMQLTTGQLNYDWAEGWIRSLKRARNLSPSTIRHRHGALARCFDWMLRKHPEIMAQNPLRLLKRGFAGYTAEDEKAVNSKGMAAKIDAERNRRLSSEEEARILTVIATRDDEQVLFILALESAMRMRECYTLLTAQVSLSKKTISLDRTKNGDSRQVPLSSTSSTLLRSYMERNEKAIAERGGRLFPYWGGDLSVEILDATTADLSRRFREIFQEAKVDDFRFHDLRHEATCRLYEKTTLSDVLIARITGHRNLHMLKRYASLRGSDLAVHLW